MFNNFIGGGQVFLHKVRMFQQVFIRTILAAMLLGVIAAIGMHSTELRQLDWPAVYSYRKAVIADDFDGAMNRMRISIGKRPNYITLVNVKTKGGMRINKIDPRKVMKAYVFRQANNLAINLGKEILLWSSS